MGWKRDERGGIQKCRAATHSNSAFGKGLRSVRLPMRLLISLDISQNQSLTQSSEFQYIRTLQLGAICLHKVLRTVLFKRI